MPTFLSTVALAFLCLALTACTPPPQTVRPEDVRAVVAGATALVVVYSRTGNTADVGKAIAEVLGADYLRLQGRGDEGGSLWSTPGWTSHVDVKPDGVDLSRYRLVLVGGPIWYWHPSALASSFLDDNDLTGKDVVLFYTFQGGGPSEATVTAWKERAVRRGARVCDVFGINRDKLPAGSSLADEARRQARARAPWCAGAGAP